MAQMVEIHKEKRIISETDRSIVILHDLYHVISENNKLNVDLEDYNCVQYVSKCGEHEKKNLRNEYIILSKLSHVNIIKTYGYMDITNTLMLEYIDGYDLVELLNGYKKTIHEIKYYFKQMALALEYCHHKKIIHRDIKLENFMINSNNIIKLIDFEFAGKIHSCNILCGTIEYLAPELVEQYYNYGNTVNAKYSYKSDIWALGITLYCMVTKVHPYCDLKYCRDKNETILEAIIENGPNYEIINDDKLKNLLERMLDKDPATRYSIKDIIECEWLKE